MASLVILQLDTHFPRIPGDIACKDTYHRPVGIQIIDKAQVASVVNADPNGLDISGFTSALASLENIGANIASKTSKASKDQIISTSCGFMIYFQESFSKMTDKTFISSSLIALPELRSRFPDPEIMVITFDADVLASPAYQPALDGFAGPVIGLEKWMHLYEVISQDLDELDFHKAELEMDQLITAALRRFPVKAIMLECKELHWFPSSATESKETSYFIIGSFNSWEEPVKMEAESKGVYAFTMVLGENRWETFQIWEDGDPDKVLHPGIHWADREQQVLGPSRQGVCGRFSTWRISGKPTKVRLLNEEQARELDMGPCAEDS
eukprot:s673_g11.t1